MQPITQVTKDAEHSLTQLLDEIKILEHKLLELQLKNKVLTSIIAEHETPQQHCVEYQSELAADAEESGVKKVVSIDGVDCSQFKMWTVIVKQEDPALAYDRAMKIIK